MSKQTKFGIFIAIVLIFIIGLGIFMSHKNSAPSKYDGLAQALTTSGAHMYGAFWCPHCQAEKALFGTAVEYLPYVECSKADKSQTQICIDNKVESYPTWKFKDGITVTSDTDPTVCPVQPGPADQNAICAQIGSTYYSTYLFNNYAFAIKSSIAPVHTGSTWKFTSPDAATAGELPLDFLASQIGYTLPQ